MNSFLEQERQMYLEREKFERNFNTEMMILENFKDIPTFITKLIPHLKKFALESSLIMPNKLEKFNQAINNRFDLAPGFPGYTETQIHQIKNMVGEICGQTLVYVQMIENVCLPKVKGAMITSITTMNNISFTTKEAFQQWKDLWEKIQSNETQLNALIKEMKANKKDVIKTHAFSLQVIEIVQNQKYLSMKMNVAYTHYLTLLSNAYDHMKRLSLERSQTILNWIEQHAEFQSTASELFRSVYLNICKKHPPDDSTQIAITDLKNYILKHQMTRTYIGNDTYEKYNFKSAEIDLYTDPCFAKGNLYEAPILVAEAIEDFVGCAENEISCEKGQEIYLYEPPNDMWTLASTNKIFPEGYIPTCCIQIKKVKTALSLKSSAYVDDWLGVFPGEFLIIESEDDGILTARNTSGKVGKIEKSMVICETCNV